MGGGMSWKGVVWGGGNSEGGGGGMHRPHESFYVIILHCAIFFSFSFYRARISIYSEFYFNRSKPFCLMEGRPWGKHEP